MSDYMALGVINIATPASPSLLTTWTAPTFTDLADVAVSGNYAYTAGDDGTVYAINISVPSVPVESGHVDLYLGAPYSLVADAGKVHVAWNHAGLRRINVSTPASPSPSGLLATPGSAWELDTAGTFAFVMLNRDGLRVLDISNPSAPTVADSVANDGIVDVAADGGHVAVADLYYVTVYTNPAGLTMVGSYPTGGTTRAVDLRGSSVYILSQTSFSIIAADDPGTLVGGMTGSYNDLVAGDGYVYATSSDFAVIDVRTPASPAQIGSCPIPGSGYGIAYQGDRAYVVGSTAELTIVDIQDPEAPAVLTSVDLPRSANNVWVEGDHALIADGVGLTVVNIGEPGTPRVVESVELPGGSWGITGSSGSILVSQLNGGVGIYQVAACIGTIFSDGFESGDLSQWPVAVN